MRPIFPRATQGEVQELCEQLDSATRDLFAGKINVHALESETPARSGILVA